MSESPQRHRFKIVVRFGISIALLCLLATRLDLRKLWSEFAEARFEYLFAVLAVLLFCRFYASYRWWVLLKLHDQQANYWPLVKLTFATCFLQAFLPTGSREILRVVGNARSTSNWSSSIVSVVAEQYFGVVALSLLTLFGLASVSSSADLGIAEWAIGGLATAMVASILVMNRGVRSVVDQLLGKSGLHAIGNRAQGVYECLDQLRESPGTMLLSLGLAIGNQLLRVIAVIFAARALGIDVPVIWFFAYVPAIVFLQLLPISIGGLGVRESAYVYFFGLQGVSAESGFAMSLIAYIGMLLSSLPGAWYCTEVFSGRFDSTNSGQLDPSLRKLS